MFHPLSAFIALRYSTAGRQTSFVSFINKFSIAGIALGLMALIIVISVMNGFEAQLRERILGIVPHVVVHTDKPPSEFTSLVHVQDVMTYREGEGVVQSRKGLRGVKMQGIVPDVMARNSIVAENLITGKFGLLQAGNFNVIVGRALALQLDISTGDTLRLMAAGATVYTPFGRIPSQRLVRVAGIYDVGSQMDDKVIYLHLDDITRLLRQPATSTPDVRLFLDNAFAYEKTIMQLRDIAPDNDNWRSRQGPLFDAVKMEKNMMFMMLLLIIAVAAFNIISSLVMVVTEKQGDIAILLTQGMQPKYVMRVFLLNGSFNGIKGALIGLVLGIVGVWQLNSFLDLLGIPIALSADGQGVPVDIHWGQITLVTVSSLLLCILASLYPAWRAMKVNPATALQND